jgi:hypothetical protein
MGQEVNSSATDPDQSAVEALNQSALEYRRLPRPEKIAVLPIKGMPNQRDLALAYSPGVAVPCMAIHADPNAAALYTSRSNLVAVVSNGTAVSTFLFATRIENSCPTINGGRTRIDEMELNLAELNSGVVQKACITSGSEPLHRL